VGTPSPRIDGEDGIYSKLSCHKTTVQLTENHHYSMVRAVGIEPTLLSEPDFESGKNVTKLLIYNDIVYYICACVLIRVLK
jgi:hypothetical protein